MFFQPDLYRSIGSCPRLLRKRPGKNPFHSRTNTADTDIKQEKYSAFSKKTHEALAFYPKKTIFAETKIHITMKQKFLSACILLMAACLATSVQTASAQQQNAQKITGIWQKLYNGKKTLLFKILNADGSYCNFGIASQDGTFSYSQQGTFKVTSDSTYTENIQKSHTGFQGESHMKYRLRKFGKELYTEWFSSQAQEWMPELWIKVE